MNKVLTITIGFLHDFASGCWAASLLTVWRLDHVIVAPEAQESINSLQKEFFWIGVVSLIIVMATGAGRTFTYISNVYGENAERDRRRMLMRKHVVLAVVFGLGTFWQYTMVWR